MTAGTHNGSGGETLTGSNGEAAVEVPRDRKGTLEPRMLRKHQTRFNGLDDKILSVYAHGMVTRGTCSGT
jgi:putative transposase